MPCSARARGLALSRSPSSTGPDFLRPIGPADDADESARPLLLQPDPERRAEPSKRVKRLLREYAAAAHGEELRRALLAVAEAFMRWEGGERGSGEKVPAELLEYLARPIQFYEEQRG
jgi:hypothetical protein